MLYVLYSPFLQMPIPEELGTLSTALWKEHGWDLCHLQRAATKQKGALGGELHAFAQHAIDRNIENLQIEKTICKGKIL